MKKLNDNDLKELGINVSRSDRLYYESAVEYIADNTTINTKDLSNLPSCAGLFIEKYVETMKRDLSVSSESLAGMSQSFRDDSIDKAIDSLARTLLSKYLKSSFKFIPAKTRW